MAFTSSNWWCGPDMLHAISKVVALRPLHASEYHVLWHYAETCPICQFQFWLTQFQHLSWLVYLQLQVLCLPTVHFKLPAQFQVLFNSVLRMTHRTVRGSIFRPQGDPSPLTLSTQQLGINFYFVFSFLNFLYIFVYFVFCILYFVLYYVFCVFLYFVFRFLYFVFCIVFYIFGPKGSLTVDTLNSTVGKLYLSSRRSSSADFVFCWKRTLVSSLTGLAINEAKEQIYFFSSFFHATTSFGFASLPAVQFQITSTVSKKLLAHVHKKLPAQVQLLWGPFSNE